jgi:DNA-binding PadR family transcriptional regulator
MTATVQKLTTTSYAVLGLLAIRPLTTYELARQISRGGQYWLHSRSKLFEEPKRLAAGGLATATPGAIGKRPRTVYTITEPGRAALAAWLATPGEPPVLESEQLLKVFYAEHGTKADLLATIGALRDWAEEELTRNAVLARQYLAGLGPYQERAAILVLTGKFNVTFAGAVRDWAEAALTEVAAWPDDLTTARPDRAAMEQMALNLGRRAG